MHFQHFVASGTARVMWNRIQQGRVESGFLVIAQANAAYNVTAALRLSGALNLDALDAAFCEIVARHGERISAKSSPGLGSCFIVSLPVPRGGA